ncbi:MurT ligase domain-containing protein [Kribbella solani]|uniref:Lipid II isoglutaminyl synthase (glutamine-hydrolyzing) subunit MurT n=1 Tax=Kribbella solani TaxID=236067 RepID=A0A841DS66_9ACTN|nr:MurT ligase domain-containing protein [Kribbella solani]MBB5980779.1 UDP-N-acetylmuramyl tripeptide synthase [Kribbella solani]
MRETAAIAVAWGTATLSRRLGRGGQALPGAIVDRIAPELPRKLAAELPHGCILVTGTNGKTTTTKLIVAALRRGGETVVTNASGANLRGGVVSALVSAADLRCRSRATIGVFEVDEASLRLVGAELQPRHIVVLNIFRDQLDRYGEVDTTADLLAEGIAATGARLYLNADDARVASLAGAAAEPGRVSYFGIDQLPAGLTAERTAADSDRCPKCGERLTFGRVFYSHLGHYSCPNGDFARPDPDVAVTGVSRADLDGTEFSVTAGGSVQRMRYGLSGTYNLYNALAAVGLATGLGLDPAVTAEAVRTTEAAFGRVEKTELQGRTLWLLLIKNPAGFAQVLDTFLVGRSHPRVLIAVNDLPADGRDVSWLWDVPLEGLSRGGPEVVTAGTRAAEMALRLHYAGTEASVASSVDDGISRLLAGVPRGGDAYILPTYTAMLQIRKALRRRVHE